MYSVCICNCTLLKVVSYYDLSVLSMSVMGFQKKSLDGVCGWGELYPSLLWIVFNFSNFAKPLNRHRLGLEMNINKMLYVLSQRPGMAA